MSCCKGLFPAVLRRDCSTFVTTPIFYANARPHLGHLYSLLLADAYVRWTRLRSPQKQQQSQSPSSRPPADHHNNNNNNNNNILFSTGTDEHGAKILRAASAAKLTPPQHCDLISEAFNSLTRSFAISNTDFIRTSSPRHRETVQDFWHRLSSRGHIRKGLHEGWYSVQDETFVPPSQVTEIVEPKTGQQVKVSSETGQPLEWASEENYLFDLEPFRKSILHWLESKKPIQPANFLPVVMAALQDESPTISVSRPASRTTDSESKSSSWGIPVPDDPSQMVYVWLDALVNYLTVADGTAHWPPTVQVVGKDIIKFHAIYWPAFLLGAGLELPHRILCHSHWTVNHVKMSKSLGNVVDPGHLAKRYTHEGLRYFLLREGTPHSDGNFCEERMRRLLNSELADTLGNLLNRSTATTINPHQIWPQFSNGHFQSSISPYESLRTAVEQLIENVRVNYDDFNYYRGLEQTMGVLRMTNLIFQENKPWELVKNDPRDPSLLALISAVLEILRVTAIILSPIVPSLSELILNRLNVTSDERCWDSIHPLVWEKPREERQLIPQQDKIIFKKIQQSS